MRKPITILGIGRHKVGNGKNGAYDITDVSITFPDDRWQGQHCETVPLSADVIDGRTLTVGQTLWGEVAEINFKTRIFCFYD